MKRVFGLLAALMFVTSFIGCCCSHMCGYSQGCGYGPTYGAPSGGGCPNCAPQYGQPGTFPKTGYLPDGATVVAETPIDPAAAKTAKAPMETVPTYE